MMVTMSSLVTLAHATAAPAFNGLFYATAAIIIPVLFLAIGVQRDSLYQYLLNALGAADDRRERSTPKRGLGRAAASVTAIVLPPIAGAFLAILVLAAYAEALAIYALGSHTFSLPSRGKAVDRGR
jgi:hypothetical protein